MIKYILTFFVVFSLQAANPSFNPTRPLTNQMPLVGLGGGRLGSTNNAAYLELLSTSPNRNVNANYGVPQVIWYTGGAGDWEDAASLQLILVLHRKGLINLRGVGLGTGGWRHLTSGGGTNDASIEAMSTLFDYYGVNPGQVPLSLYTNTTWGFLPLYTNAIPPTNVFKLYTYYMTNHANGKYFQSQYMGTNYESTLRMFRRVLSAADTNSIRFCINHPVPPIQQLFDSTADEFSPLTGQALFNSRVRDVTIMAGDYPTNYVQNGEYNISTSTGATFSNVVARITRPITWIGFSIGSTPLPTEPVHLKSMAQGWRNLNMLNPLYDLAYQNTDTGNAGRSAWGGIHALVAALSPTFYYSQTNIPYLVPTNYFTTNTVVWQGVTLTDIYTASTNYVSNLFGFVVTGTNYIEASGTNWWRQDGVDHNQRYLSYIHTNLAQFLLNTYNYSTEFDPYIEKFDNTRAAFLGIGTPSPVDRVHIAMSNSVAIFRSDNNYAKLRFGGSASAYGELASQGTDLLFSSGTSDSGMFEFYQNTFTGGAANLRGKMGTNGGWYFGSGGNSHLENGPRMGEVWALSNMVAGSITATNHFIPGQPRTLVTNTGVGTLGSAATNEVAATGITNLSRINRQVLVIPTATAYQVKNSVGTVVANVPSGSTPMVWTLQPTGAVTSASGLAGTLLDW